MQSNDPVRSKNYQNTFVETSRISRKDRVWISGPTILVEPLNSYESTSVDYNPEYLIEDCKEISDCKKCKWGLKMVIGLCGPRYHFEGI